MKNRVKKSLSLLLAVIMFLCAVPMRGSAAYENTYTNTGNQRNDIIGVAKTQLGYKEGYNNDTKYGTWYGLPNQPWCAMFISWCARQAGIPTSVLKNSAVAAPDAKYFNIPYYDGASYTPKSGDLFFTKSFSHVGLVYYVDGSYFYTIEGNSNTTGSSEGTSVVSNKRKTSNFYFGVPNYSGNISHTVNSSYGKNFTSYPKSKITAANIFDAYHNQISSTAWIGTSDKCTIHEVYTDGCCKVSYPLDSGGTKTVYSKISLFNTHKHSYSANYESAHPHKEYMKCSCGDWYYTGATKYVDSCTVCNPPRVVFDKSNVSLGLSKNKTAQVTAVISGEYSHWLCEWDGNNIGVSKEQNGNKIVMTVSSRTAGTSRLSLKVQDNNYKTISEAYIDVCVNYDYNNAFDFSYSSNGGTGDSLPFSVKYGDTFTVLNNSCQKAGFHFGGWNVKRNADNTWYVAGVGWCSEETIGNNKYEKKNYVNSQELVFDESWVKGLNSGSSYTFYATWIQNKFTMRFDANSGIGYMNKISTEFDSDYVFPNSEFTRENYVFGGWNVYRVNDGKWATVGYGWLTSEELNQRNINKQLFVAGDSYNLDDSWKNGCEDEYIDYVAYATWIPCQHTYSVIKTSVSNCTKEGYRLFECKTCGATKTETVAKNPSNHAGGTAVKNSKAATCTANGYTGDTYCLGCGVTTSKGREISAKGHSYDSGKITTAATCKATGVKTYTCTVCKATKTETVAKLNHRDSNGDGKCDMCGFKVGESGKPDTPDDSSNNCNHICHKSGFEHFLYIIVRMFWRLFKINQVCDCGFKHY